MVSQPKQIKVALGFGMSYRAGCTTHPDSQEPLAAKKAGVSLHELGEEIKALAINRGAGETKKKTALCTLLPQCLNHLLRRMVLTLQDLEIDTRSNGQIFRIMCAASWPSRTW